MHSMVKVTFLVMALVLFTSPGSAIIIMSHDDNEGFMTGGKMTYLENLTLSSVGETEAVVMNKYMVTEGSLTAYHRLELYSPAKGWVQVTVGPDLYFTKNTDPGMILQANIYIPWGNDTNRCDSLQITGRSARNP